MKNFKLHFKFLLLVNAFFIFTNISYSQWMYIGEPSGFAGHRPQLSVVDENTAFATGGYVNVTYKTTDGGANWIQLNTDLLRPFWAIWGKDANTLFAGDDGGGVDGGGHDNVGDVENLYKTTNSGINWSLIYSTAGKLAAFRGMRFSNSMPSFGIALGSTDGNFNIYKTRDGGDTWTKTVVPGYPNARPAYYSLVVIDSLFYAFGTSLISPSIVITTDGGATWNLRYLNLPSIGPDITRGVAFKDDKLTGIAGANSSTIISRTTNGGLNWVNIDLGHNVINSRGPVMRWVEGTDICYLTSTGTPDWGGVLKSTNGGLNWTRMTTDGFGIFSLDTKRIGSNIYGYANNVENNLGGNVILKVIDAIVGINQISELVPDGYNLSQNYPNPFNPVTKIKFEITRDARREMQDVRLVMYNSLGKEVTTLVNENLNVGSYEVDFDGINFSSGVYFYKLVVDGNTIDTKRMMLLK